MSINDPTGACKQSSVQINNEQGSLIFCEGADISRPQATMVANVIPTGSKMEVTATCLKDSRITPVHVEVSCIKIKNSGHLNK